MTSSDLNVLYIFIHIIYYTLYLYSSVIIWDLCWVVLVIEI